MMKFFLLTFNVLTISVSSYALEQRIGNGGNVVVCESTSELLDYYEARVQRQERIQTYDIEGSWPHKVNSLLERLKRVSPKRAEVYQKQADEFLAEAIILYKTRFVEIPDSDHITLPVGCSIVQGIVQVEPDLPGKKRYTINGDLWDTLDEATRAGLILHEIIYREAISYGHKNSIAVRYLTGFISSERMTSVTQESWIELLRKLDFKKTDIQGLPILLEYNKKPAGIEFYSNGRLAKALVDPDIEFIYNGARINVFYFGEDQLPTVRFFENGNISSFTCGLRCGPFFLAGEKYETQLGRVSFFENGEPQFFGNIYQDKTIIQLGNRIFLKGRKNVDVQFFPSGIVKSIQLFHDGLMWHQDDQQWVKCGKVSREIIFWENGKLKSCQSIEGQVFIKGKLTKLNYRSSKVFFFDREGQFIEALPTSCCLSKP